MKEIMVNSWDSVVRAAAAMGGFVAGLYGGFDGAMKVLLICMAIDYLSGIIVALMGKSKKSESGGLSSNIGLTGLFRKGMMMLVVLVGALLDMAMGTGTTMCRDAACWFYIANECLSILENSSLAGVPWPAAIKNVLDQMKSEETVEKE